MKTIHSSLLTGALVSVAGLVSVTAGCELIAGIDRGQIGGGGDAGASVSSSSSSGEGGMAGHAGHAGMGGGGMGGAGGGGMGGQGGAPECVMDTDCTSPANECSTVACTDGTCVTTNLAAGTEIAAQTPGDCKVAVCDGTGNIISQDLDTDTATDNKECTQDTCSGGMLSYPPVASGTMCMENGGKVCDAAGACVECNVGMDCASGVCQANVCQAAECGDMVQNGTESDVDCGGMCGGCDDGKMCMIGTDCTSMVCDAGTMTCAAPTCDDMVKNGSETDADCGGPCPDDCKDGEGCMVHDDCTSGFCNPMTNMCATPACNDGFQNGDETDTDCGGTCPSTCMNGQDCTKDADCSSGYCNAMMVCAAPTCTDMVQNGTETDIDCGGSCPSDCMNGQGCMVNGDCTSGYCDAMLTCAAPSCTDMIENGTETDVDCGGTCPNDCMDGQGCMVDGDCTSGYCNALMTCAVATCSDGIQNGTETGVDCGGTCPKCNGDACTNNSECSSGMCYEGACVASVNGCDINTAQDFTAMPLTITFTSFSYTPKCAKVKVGAVVTINGSYSNHPLEGGIVSGGMLDQASSGPFIPVTNTGTTKNFTMSSTGTFPYYCVPHALGGMIGAVFVVP
ncbi:MAG: hypothetical protein IPM54_14610 [Polyangiaceae bacterium]|nr:hypothetical protein [Polyangiaceae bacterium]